MRVSVWLDISMNHVLPVERVFGVLIQTVCMIMALVEDPKAFMDVFRVRILHGVRHYHHMDIHQITTTCGFGQTAGMV